MGRYRKETRFTFGCGCVFRIITHAENMKIAPKELCNLHKKQYFKEKLYNNLIYSSTSSLRNRPIRILREIYKEDEIELESFYSK